ncbi:hypothetical protein V6Z11_A11G284900 [Gossypium hirsutum]
MKKWLLNMELHANFVTFYLHSFPIRSNPNAFFQSTVILFLSSICKINRLSWKVRIFSRKTVMIFSYTRVILFQYMIMKTLRCLIIRCISSLLINWEGLLDFLLWLFCIYFNKITIC